LDRKRRLKRAVLISFMVAVLVVLSVFAVSMARAQVEPAETTTGAGSSYTGWAFLAASIATGFGCVGAGIAVAYVGAAAVGAVGEKPEVAGRTLIFVGLAEGIAIYGLIIAIMILGKV
jgi:V/A-type H+-transporting ATPase subunit K